MPQHVVPCSVLQTYILSASLIILPTGCYFTYYWLNQTNIQCVFLWRTVKSKLQMVILQTSHGPILTLGFKHLQYLKTKQNNKAVAQHTAVLDLMLASRAYRKGKSIWGIHLESVLPAAWESLVLCRLFPRDRLKSYLPEEKIGLLFLL